MDDSLSASANAGAAISIEEQRTQLHKLLSSEALRNSPGLKKFLDYITTKTIEGQAGAIKEYVIGTEVLGRTETYDPKVDTVVRVQASRLRNKIEKYYAREGATDPILLNIPKGHYVPTFSRRTPPPTAELPEVNGANGAASRPELPSVSDVEPTNGYLHGVPAPARPRLSTVVAMAIVGACVLVAGLLVSARILGLKLPGVSEMLGRSAALAASVSSPTQAVWAEFLKPASATMVGFSNSIFLATEDSDLLRVKSEEIDNPGAPAGSDEARRLSANPALLSHAGPVFFEDLYTGTGEVMATFYLTRLFTQERSPLEVKRGRLVTIDDLGRHDMIFLGSTVENNLLAKLPLPEDFVFVLPPGAPHLWGWRVVNLRPRTGETQSFETERDPKTGVLRTDYALVSFLPGITPERRIAILGGLTTIGTQAAAEFATSRAGTAEIMAHLGQGPASARRLPRFYQAVLKVEIMKGDVLRVDYVTGHTIQASTPTPPRS
jgi:hypothetical protein